MKFTEKLAIAIKKKNSCLMLGLDPNKDKMPKEFHKIVKKKVETGQSKNIAWAQAYYDFCREILAHTETYICGIKIQMAYFEVLGSAGIIAVENLIKLAHERQLIVLIDGKRGDIGTTCEAYAKAYLEAGELSADSLTVNPFLGSDGVKPFINLCEQNNRGIFILVKTSNPSANEFQENISDKIAKSVEEWGKTTRAENGFSSIGAVVGATNGKDLLHFRTLMPHTWILAPGIGAQGGSMTDVLNAQKNGLGIIIPVSRSVLYASSGDDFAEAASIEIQRLWNMQKN
jgi:orotidine-5'-phosphate decarboxylase